jgi:drug/metabolite transporter superfamily protein YnfA
VGLLRSRVVHPWIPWLALLAIPIILVNGLLWALLAYGWLVHLDGSGIGNLLVALAGVFVVPAMFWLALGTDLILRACKVTTGESDRFVADGVIPGSTE